MSEMKLRECPFCGGEKVHCRDWGDGESQWHIECDDCDLTVGEWGEHYSTGKAGSNRARLEAIAAWNRRSPDPRLAMAREALNLATGVLVGLAKDVDAAAWVHDDTYPESPSVVTQLRATLKALEEGK